MLNPIDPSIYGLEGQWTAEILEIIQAIPKNKKAIKIGNGMDFKEEDVQRIIDTTTGEVWQSA
jgi:hypothetical protein